MLAAIALAAAGFALAVSALCAWLTWTQAIAAQRLAREAARQAEDVAHMRDVTAQMVDAQTTVIHGDSQENRAAIAVAERSARAADRSASAAEASARSAEVSAQAAEESARATRMLAEAGQRAYVSVGSMQVLRSDLSAGFPTAVRCEIRNTGKTPALSVVSCQWLRPLAELPADPDYTGIDSVSTVDLGPGSVQSSDAAMDGFDPNVTQALRSRELTMFLFGISRYTDIFGLVRQTRWAFYWNYEKRQFARYERHNDMN
jgi:hypothetical protein